MPCSADRLTASTCPPNSPRNFLYHTIGSFENNFCCVTADPPSCGMLGEHSWLESMLAKHTGADRSEVAPFFALCFAGEHSPGFAQQFVLLSGQAPAVVLRRCRRSFVWRTALLRGRRSAQRSTARKAMRRGRAAPQKRRPPRQLDCQRELSGKAHSPITSLTGSAHSATRGHWHNDRDVARQ